MIYSLTFKGYNDVNRSAISYKLKGSTIVLYVGIKRGNCQRGISKFLSKNKNDANV